MTTVDMVHAADIPMTLTGPRAQSPQAANKDGGVVHVRRDRSALPVRLFRRGAARVRSAWLRRHLAVLGAGSHIARPAWIVGGRGIAVGRDVHIWHDARLEALNVDPGAIRIEIGDGTIIQPYVHIGAIDRVSIGRGVLMASRVYISDHDHDYSDPDDPVVSNHRLIVSPVTIDDYAWLGEGVCVLKGVHIGAHSIVGAASVVTRDVPPYSIVVGCPARVVRQFDPGSRTWKKVQQS